MFAVKAIERENQKDRERFDRTPHLLLSVLVIFIQCDLCCGYFGYYQGDFTEIRCFFLYFVQQQQQQQYQCCYLLNVANGPLTKSPVFLWEWVMKCFFISSLVFPSNNNCNQCSNNCVFQLYFYRLQIHHSN